MKRIKNISIMACAFFVPMLIWFLFTDDLTMRNIIWSAILAIVSSITGEFTFEPLLKQSFRLLRRSGKTNSKHN